MLKFSYKKRIGDNMKKKAFTVAEILITLGIIGVVSALTIPQLTQNGQRKVYANKLSAAVSDFENAMTTMLMREGKDLLQETPAWTDNFLGELTNIFPHKTDKITDIERKNLDKTDGIDFPKTDEANKIYLFRNHKGFYYSVNVNGTLSTQLENKVMAEGGAMTSLAAYVYIDANGDKKPNMWGRDCFVYALGGDGHLYPYGGKDFNIYLKVTESTDPKAIEDYSSTTPRKKCVDDKDWKFCSAYLAGNGYNMDY